MSIASSLPTTLVRTLEHEGVDLSPIGGGFINTRYGRAQVLRFEWPKHRNGTSWDYTVLAVIYEDGSYTMALQVQGTGAPEKGELRAMAHASYATLNPAPSRFAPIECYVDKEKLVPGKTVFLHRGEPYLFLEYARGPGDILALVVEDSKGNMDSLLVSNVKGLSTR